MKNTLLIIPTLNAESTIKNLLQKLIIEDIDILVIDSSSTDKTIDITKDLGVDYIQIKKEDFRHGGTRTLGAKYKENIEYLIYMTQDAIIYNKNSIKNILKPFKDKKVGAVCGRQIPHINEGIFGKHLREFNYPKQSHIREYKDKTKYGIKTAFLSNSFASYRYSALKEVGFFKDDIIFGEDMFVASKMLQQGYKIVYQADAIVYHSHSYSLSQEFKRYFDMGKFHTQEKWILDDFGKAEGQGKKFVISEIKYLIKNGRFYLLPLMIIRTSFKFLGYKLAFLHSKI